ncbi:transposase [Azospirillum sp. 11R-A]|uniref:transposase n=1 Tax=Azospirillum sp. 11R-A TaxID=3111634 RepID=UPI003C189FB9
MCGPSEWLIEKHGTKRRRSWRALHIGMDAGSGRIVAATLTDRGVEDASQFGPLFDRISAPVASRTGDGAYDRSGVYAAVHERHRKTAVVAPPRAHAVLSDRAHTVPSPRDHHIQAIPETGQMAWQRSSGYNKWAGTESKMTRWKGVIGEALHFHGHAKQATEVVIGVAVLNRIRPRTPELRPRRLTISGVEAVHYLAHLPATRRPTSATS